MPDFYAAEDDDFSVREELDDCDRADTLPEADPDPDSYAALDPMLAPYAEFRSEAADGLTVGADALLFVMAHGHTLTVPTPALMFAEKVAIISIARNPPPGVLRDVNRAIDLIAASLRTRAALDAEAIAAVRTAAAAAIDDRPNEGPMARLRDRPIVSPLPPSAKVRIEF